MSVLEMKSHAHPTVRWTEVCPDDHRGQASRAARPRVAPAAVRSGIAPGRSVVRPGGDRPAVAAVRTGTLVRSRVPARPTPATTVAPGRRVLVRPAAADQVRACHVGAPTPGGVVDDVPAWVLLACGIAFGVIMLLAVAFLGGPAYM